MQTNSSSSPAPIVWLMIVSLALIWGGAFLFGRILMHHWPPFLVVFLRVFIAAITLWLYLFVMGMRIPVRPKLWGAFLIMGLLNNAIPFSLILIGQQQIGAGLASVVNAMTPIWTLVFANFLTSDEKFTPNKITGICCGFCGVVVLVGSDAIQGLSASAWAQVAVLGATISYGLAGIFGKRFKSEKPAIVATGQLTASSLLMLPLALMYTSQLSELPFNQEILLSLAGLAIICTAIAYLLFFRILAMAGATTVSLVTFLIPISAILLGYLWLGERFGLTEFSGTALILLGLATIDGKIFRKKVVTNNK